MGGATVEAVYLSFTADYRAILSVVIHASLTVGRDFTSSVENWQTTFSSREGLFRLDRLGFHSSMLKLRGGSAKKII